MKKFNLLAGVSALALAVTACGDDADRLENNSAEVVDSNVADNDTDAVEENEELPQNLDSLD